MTLWDLKASSLGPLQIVYVILNTTNGVVHMIPFEGFHFLGI